MKKLLILSDSHGEYNYMEQAVSKEQPDVIMHLGDYDRDAEHLTSVFPGIPVISLRGNCDMMSFAALQYVDEIEQVRLFACHGHRHNVKNGLLQISLAAQEQNVKLCMFGHTHVPLLTESYGTIFLNPGACGGYHPSYAVVELNKGSIRANIRKFTD